MEGGSLAVPNASQIMPVVLKLISDTKDRIIVASKVVLVEHIMSNHLY